MFGITSSIFASTINALTALHGERVGTPVELAVIHEALSRVEDAFRLMPRQHPPAPVLAVESREQEARAA